MTESGVCPRCGESGVCPRCGESVNFFTHMGRTRICPNCGLIMDIDDIQEEKE